MCWFNFARGDTARPGGLHARLCLIFKVVSVLANIGCMGLKVEIIGQGQGLSIDCMAMIILH